MAGLLFFAGIFPAYYSLSRPYRAKMDARGIMGAILGVMANLIQCLALHFFNHFPFFESRAALFFLISGPALPIFSNQWLKFAFRGFLAWTYIGYPPWIMGVCRSNATPPKQVSRKAISDVAPYIQHLNHPLMMAPYWTWDRSPWLKSHAVAWL